jgi:Mind bomb SH3 repeat domain
MPFRHDLQAGRIQQGDTVKIISNLSELQRLQKGHGGFLPQMVAVSEFKF